MVIASAKSQSLRGASHQPALMVSFLTIGHTCLPCLPSGMVSHCFPGFTEVGSSCHSRKWVWSSRPKLCCHLQGSKMLVGGWWRGTGGKVMRWQGGKGRRVVRWEDGRFLVLFKGGEDSVSPRFYLFVSDVNQGVKGRSDVNQRNEGDGLKIFLRASRDGKTLLRSSASC